MSRSFISVTLVALLSGMYLFYFLKGVAVLCVSNRFVMYVTKISMFFIFVTMIRTKTSHSAFRNPKRVTSEDGSKRSFMKFFFH